MIQIERVISKLDEYYAKNDLPGGEKHLDYWLAEAEMTGDVRGQIAVLSEQAGLCRMLDKGEKALRCADKVLTLLKESGLEDNVSGATVMVNCATVFAAFGKAEKSVGIFEKAGKVYQANLAEDNERFGSLYNNHAAGLKDLGRFDEALAMYEKALAVMGKAKDGQCEQAVTYLNMAGVVQEKDGLWDGSEEIEKYLRKAEDLLNDPSLGRDVHYAITCSKCVSVFRYYGYFACADELEKRAKDIYAGN